MDDRQADRLIKAIERIERHLEAMARDKHSEVSMLVDERASIEQTEAGRTEFQEGQLGRISLSWTQHPELRGQQVFIKEAIMAHPAPGEPEILHYVVGRQDRPAMLWTVPAVAFIAE